MSDLFDDLIQDYRKSIELSKTMQLFSWRHRWLESKNFSSLYPEHHFYAVWTFWRTLNFTHLRVLVVEALRILLLCLSDWRCSKNAFTDARDQSSSSVISSRLVDLKIECQKLWSRFSNFHSSETNQGILIEPQIVVLEWYQISFRLEFLSSDSLNFGVFFLNNSPLACF